MSQQLDSDSHDARSRTILLVEDEILIRLTAAEILRDHGYIVAEAADADEAVKLLSAGEPPAVVITDLRMPGSMNGLALASWVKQKFDNVPVAILSSHLEGHDLGFIDAFISKPFPASELHESVRALMELSWKRQIQQRNAS